MSNHDIDDVLPAYSAESEQSVLGGLLVSADPNNERVLDVVSMLRADDFYFGANAAVFEAIAKRVDGLQPFDTVLLHDNLADNALVNHEGGLEYLVNLARSTPSLLNIKAHAERVREYSVQRIAEARLQSALQELRTGEGSISDRVSTVDGLLSDISAPTSDQANHLVSQRDAVKQYVDVLDWRFNNPGIHGLTTGFADIDNRHQGLKKADLVVVAGRPSMGKTTFGMGIANHAAINGKRVLVFSLEMPQDGIVQRQLAALGQIPLNMLKTASVLSDSEYSTKLTAAVGRLRNADLLIDQSGGLDVGDLRSRARRAHRQKPVDLILIDYLQLMNDRTEKDRLQVVSSISRKLKALAKELDCVVIALSQLNRSLEQRTDRRPKNADLRESGQIEQDADVIMMLYRDEVYNENTQSKGIAEVITTKFRDGEIGTDYLVFHGAENRFDNLARPYQEVAAPKAKSFEY